MNYLKTVFKLKLGKSNPYEIKNQYKLLNSVKSQAVAFFQNKHKLNDDTYVLRFRFDEDKCLGRKIGQYINIQLNNQSRSYVPISRIDDAGFVDVLVRDMSHIAGKSSFSGKLVNLSEGSQVVLKGPLTQYIYDGNGKFTLKDQQKIFRYIGVIAEASSITSTYSLIESIVSNNDTHTSLSLLWMGDKLSDFVLLDELLLFKEVNKINMNLFLNKMVKNWPGPYGILTPEHINDFLPYPGDQTIVIISGGDDKIKHLAKCCEQVGHKNVLVI